MLVSNVPPKSMNEPPTPDFFPTWKKCVVVLLPFALAHFVSYLYRTVNAVVYPDIAEELDLAANQIGLLTSAYFLAFALAQLPVGVCLDRYGPRRLQIPMLMLAVLGALGFSYATTVTELVIARGVIGLGVAGCLMSAMKASSLWFSQEHLPLIMAVLLSVGGMGAMASTVPMHMVIDIAGWRYAFIILAMLTLFVVVLILMVVPEQYQRQDTLFVDMLLAVKQLYSSWSFWRLVLYSVFANAAYMSIQGLWMGPWLRDVAGFSLDDVSYILFLCTVAMCAGSLLFGILANYLRRFGVQPILVCGFGIVLFILCQCLMVIDTGISPVLIVISFSFFGTAATLNYAIVAQSMPVNLTGRVSTSFNLIIFLLAFIMQWGMGSIINLWEIVDGRYPLIAYQYAFGIVIIFQFFGLYIWLSFSPWRRGEK